MQFILFLLNPFLQVLTDGICSVFVGGEWIEDDQDPKEKRSWSQFVRAVEQKPSTYG